MSREVLFENKNISIEIWDHRRDFPYKLMVYSKNNHDYDLLYSKELKNKLNKENAISLAFSFLIEHVIENKKVRSKLLKTLGIEEEDELFHTGHYDD